MAVIKTGNNGPLVGCLQRALNSLAYNYQLPESGQFDDTTTQAVIHFQQTNNLLADGIVGGNTWTALYLHTVKPRLATSKTDRQDNILHLHPIMRRAVASTYFQLQSEQIPLLIFEVFRYPERQAYLYAQGRTRPGNIITYARPWSSYHQYGLAVDFVLYIDGNWSWDTSREYERCWRRMHEIGAAHGLMRLDFETPHLQLAGTSSNALREGLYPPDGDRYWADNLTAAIRGM